MLTKIIDYAFEKIESWAMKAKHREGEIPMGSRYVEDWE